MQHSAEITHSPVPVQPKPERLHHHQCEHGWYWLGSRPDSHATGNRMPAVEEEDFHSCPSRSPSTEAVTPVFADAVALL